MINEFKARVQKDLPDSDLTRISEHEIQKLREKFDGIPEDYIALLSEVGWGSYDDMGFCIYNRLLEPIDIFDPETAKDLDGYLFAGDDFSGWMIGYNTKETPWELKEFNHQDLMDLGEEGSKTIIDFLTKELFDRE